MLKRPLQNFGFNRVDDGGLVLVNVVGKGRGATRGGAEPLQAPALHRGTGISQIEERPSDVGTAVRIASMTLTARRMCR